MKKILFIILVQLISCSLLAQIHINGKLTDSITNEAIAMADIIVFKKADSTFVKSVYTDDYGSFTIELDKNPDLFYLIIEALNYDSKKVSLKTSNTILIQLNPGKMQVLDGVTLVAQKKPFP